MCVLVSSNTVLTNFLVFGHLLLVVDSDHDIINIRRNITTTQRKRHHTDSSNYLQLLMTDQQRVNNLVPVTIKFSFKQKKKLQWKFCSTRNSAVAFVLSTILKGRNATPVLFNGLAFIIICLVPYELPCEIFDLQKAELLKLPLCCWNFAPLLFLFFCEVAHPPSCTSAEACLAGWPNAQMLHYSRSCKITRLSKLCVGSY